MKGESGTNDDLRLLETLDRLAGALHETGEETAASQTRELAQKLRDEQIQVVVMGEFKRGKSSLINALLGRPLLPVAAVPLTAVVTIVKAGERDEAAVELLDGSFRAIEISAIEDYVSEERNHKNAKQVDKVIVRTPSAFLAGGTLLVDTPGAGSVYRHNTEVTRKYIPNCDAVILVLSADPPISESEVEFLHSVRRWAKKLFVVQNKIDYLSGPDVNRSVAFTEKVLRDALGDPQATLFPVSAKRALEAKRSGDPEAFEKSGFAAFIAALQSMLEQEKKAVVRESVRSKACALLDRELIELDLELGALHSGADKWKQQVKGLKQALADAQRKQYEFTKLYQAELKDQVKAMEEALYARVRLETKRIAGDLERLYALVQAEPAAQIRTKLNRAYLDAVEDSFTRFLAEEEPNWSRRFQQMTDRYLSETVALADSVLGAAAVALGVPHRPLSKPPISIAPPSVWFVLEEVSIWSGGIQSTPTLRIFKSFFWRALQRKIAESMDVNAGRMRYDYSRRLEQAGDESLATIQGFFESSISALEKAVTKTAKERTSATGSAAAQLARLEAHRARLSSLAEGVLRG